jgi:1-acyl-sn-glycerol-3-phosphate acyltransferase
MGRKLWGVYQISACWVMTAVFCVLICAVLSVTFRLFSHALAARLLRIYGRLGCWISRVEVILEGEEHLELPPPCVMVMNHTSVIDIFVMCCNMPPRTVVVGKKEMLLIPFIGQAYWLMRYITVDRSNSERAVASMAAANRTIRDHGLRLLVAPEGTRTLTGDLGPFKKGAFYTAMELGCPVIALVMAGSFALHPSGQISTTPGRVRVRALPPMDSSDFTRENLQEKADELRERMLVALEEMYTSDDKLLRVPPGSEQENIS